MTRDGRPSRPDGTFVYEADDIVKNFGGTQALKGVTVGFRAGQIHAIVGENGAGKSTLVKILCGVYPSGSYAGGLRLDGSPVQVQSVHDAELHGVLLVPQDLQVVPELSVADNLFLNHEPSRFGMVRSDVLWARAAASLAEFGLKIDPTDRMGDLMPAEQQLVVIARGMMRGVRVLALDEPTAALTDAEAQILFDHIEKLRQAGMAIIYISHRLDEITRIADVVTVLRDGKVVDHLESGDAKETAQRIVRAMVGRDIDLNRRSAAEIGHVRLSLDSVSVAGPDGPPRVRDLSLDVHAGEVVGIFGSIGCGSDDLVRALLGTSGDRVSGTIRVENEIRSFHRPADAMRAGIGYLPGDRQRDGIFPLLSVEQNIGMLTLQRMTQGPMIVPAREAALVNDFFDRFRVKAGSLDDSISTLSGGNQQKVMLARVLSLDPEILILHDPTQGVDIATKEELYRLVDRLAHDGKAVLIVSSDLEEIMAASDRVIALHMGQAAGMWSRSEARQHDVLAAATGGA